MTVPEENRRKSQKTQDVLTRPGKMQQQREQQQEKERKREREGGRRGSAGEEGLRGRAVPEAPPAGEQAEPGGTGTSGGEPPEQERG
ncbi:hypothetical protein [Streptomyces sp. YIM 98790]|uniref:hypothetical protein n=1 Tax=Streptomyces sp. YIM 98790 TaxID=2689077 RepID=UPI0014092E5A|nr:hypothetical protein [Streptomyces sp. YIM 98790]